MKSRERFLIKVQNLIFAGHGGNTQHLRVWGRWISEFEVSLVYRVSSRTVRSTQRNPVLQKNKTKQNKTKTKTKNKTTTTTTTKKTKTKFNFQLCIYIDKTYRPTLCFSWIELQSKLSRLSTTQSSGGKMQMRWGQVPTPARLLNLWRVV